MLEQLIEVLQQIQEKAGNIPVYLATDITGPYDILSDILTYEDENEEIKGVVLKSTPEE